MNHQINRLTVDMQCPDEGMAFNVRHHFAQNMQAEMIEVMEEICTKYTAENEWLRIDKLEIDVGEFDNTVFDKNFKTVFAKQFERILKEKISNIPLVEKEAAQIKSLTEVVRHFLLHGILPWWVDKNEFDINDAITNFLAQPNDAAKIFFTQQQNNQQLWQRVALQLNNEAKETIVDYLVPLKEAQKIAVDVLQTIVQTFGESQIVDIKLNQEDIIDCILKSAKIFLSTPINNALVLMVIINSLHEIIKIKEPYFTELKEVLNKQIVEGNNSIELIGIIKEIIKKNADEIITQAEVNDDEEQEKYQVQQAGIVLLSPFYKPFFNNLKLLEAGKWVSKEAQIKAVHLLYFISTGLLEAPEYNVTLEKVLCGLPIEFPVPIKIELTQAEMDECESLITSAVEHWDALKATSVQGFRQTFLQREGILKPKESSWLLQVERKTLDVLLEKVPWGFNTIFLPWVSKLINVEW